MTDTRYGAKTGNICTGKIMSKPKNNEEHESRYFGGIDAMLLWELMELEKRLERRPWWRRCIYFIFRV